MPNNKKEKAAQTNVSTGIWMPREELRAIDEMADRYGISRNALFRLSFRQLGEMEFLDAQGLMQAAEKMDSTTCRLEICLKSIETIMNLILEKDDTEYESLNHALEIMQGKLVRIQGGMIDDEKRVGRMLLDYEGRTRGKLEKPINR